MPTVKIHVGLTLADEKTADIGNRLLEFNVPFRHKYGYIRDKRSRVESYPYSVKKGQQ